MKFIYALLVLLATSFQSVLAPLSCDCGVDSHCVDTSCTVLDEDNCNYTCSACAGNFAPDQCTSCLSNYVGTNCTIVCSPLCAPQSCAASNSSASGYSCPACINANFADDQCLAGNCKPGFSGDNCTTVLTTTASTTTASTTMTASNYKPTIRADAGDFKLNMSIGNSNENDNSNELMVGNGEQSTEEDS